MGLLIESPALNSAVRSAIAPDFDAKNAVVVGLSADDVASHKAFCDKFSFSIELLADPDAKLLSALGSQVSDFLVFDRATVGRPSPFLPDPIWPAM